MPYHHCHECTEYIFHTLTSLLRCVWSHFQLTSVCPLQTDAFLRERLLTPVKRFHGLPSKASLGIVDFAASIVLQSVSHVFHTSSRNKPDGNYYFMEEIHLHQQTTAFPPWFESYICGTKTFLNGSILFVKATLCKFEDWRPLWWKYAIAQRVRTRGFLNVPWVEHLIIPSALISRSNKSSSGTWGEKISCPLGYNVGIYIYTYSNVTQVTIWTSLNSFIV